MQHQLSSRYAVFLTLMFLTFSASEQNCRAALIISFQNTFVTSGGTGSVDVYIRSTTGLDSIDFASYAFDITNPNTPSGVLRFQSSESQLKTEQSVASPFPYVFLNDSADENIGATVQDSSPQSITGFNRTTTGDPRTIGTSNLLLARFELQHIGAEQSGIFTIQLREDPNLTIFTSNEDEELLALLDPQSYTNFGSITVSANAVPEPSSVVLCSLMVGGFAFRRLRRAKIA